MAVLMKFNANGYDVANTSVADGVRPRVGELVCLKESMYRVERVLMYYRHEKAEQIPDRLYLHEIIVELSSV